MPWIPTNAHAGIDHGRRLNSIGTLLKSWTHFVPAIFGFVSGFIRMLWQGSKLWIDAALAGLLWAACFYVVAWIGSFLINYFWRIPAALHREPQSTIQTQHTSIEQLTRAAAEPPISPRERENRENIGALLTGASEEELGVLKHLLNNEEVLATQLFLAIQHRGVIERSLEKWRPKLIAVRVEHGTNRTFYSIIPGLKKALEHILYP